MSEVTFGDLCNWLAPGEDEQKAYKALIKVLHEHYPKGWEAWEVTHIPFDQLFGEALSPETENRIRFAIPTVELVRCFHEDASSISERRFKILKRTLIKWPIGRALIYAPHAVMEKMHQGNSYLSFMDTVKSLKSQGKLISRQDASAILETLVSDSRQSSRASSRKRSRGDEDTEYSASTRSKNARDDQILDLMKSQNEMFRQLLEVSADQTNNIKELKSKLTPGLPSLQKQESLDASFDSTMSAESMVSDYKNFSGEEDKENWQAPHFNFQNPEELESGTLYNFNPVTTETEPKIGIANPLLAKQGEECQRLGSSGWTNIKYTDIQKKFQATPVFSNLKVNSLLANVTPPWQQVKILERTDLLLGAITHGLLQERQEFQDIYDKSEQTHKTFISKHFLSPDSKFKKTSDTLLQYVCGKRVETIQQRRAMYRGKNKNLSELLHNIPPSSTHLFEEKALSELIKDHDGPNKFLRTNRSSKYPPTKQVGRRPGYNYNPRLHPRGGQSFKPQSKYKPQGQTKQTKQFGGNFHKKQRGAHYYRGQNKM